MNDKEMIIYLQDLGYEIYDDNGIEIWHELAINEGYSWNDDLEIWED